MLQTQGRRRAFKAEGTAHTTAWRECVLGSDAEVSRGRIAKGLECREEQGRQRGVVSKRRNDWTQETQSG